MIYCVGFLNNKVTVSQFLPSTNRMFTHVLELTPTTTKIIQNDNDVTNAVAEAIDGKINCIKYVESMASGSWSTKRMTITSGETGRDDN